MASDLFFSVRGNVAGENGKKCLARGLPRRLEVRFQQVKPEGPHVAITGLRRRITRLGFWFDPSLVKYDVSKIDP